MRLEEIKPRASLNGLEPAARTQVQAILTIESRGQFAA